MSIYMKNEQGEVKKVGGSVIQRWNDRIFQTIHTVNEGADYYEIEESASKFILSFTPNTEYQLYIGEPNETTTVYITFKGQTMELKRTNGGVMEIGKLTGRVHCYSLDLSSGELYTDTAVEIQLLNADILNSVKKTGNETIDGIKTFLKALIIAEATLGTHAIQKGQAESLVSGELTGHNSSTVAHVNILMALQDMQREIDRLMHRGASYGEIPRTTAALLAIEDPSLRDMVIIGDIRDGMGGPVYEPSVGDLVYDIGVGIGGEITVNGVNYHEWEWNGTHWVDNGAVVSPRASNQTFGIIKGNEYLDIINGVIQVLKSDIAQRLGDDENSFSYSELVTYIANQVITNHNSLDGIQGSGTYHITAEEATKVNDLANELEPVLDLILGGTVYTPSSTISYEGQPLDEVISSIITPTPKINLYNGGITVYLGESYDFFELLPLPITFGCYYEIEAVSNGVFGTYKVMGDEYGEEIVNGALLARDDTMFAINNVSGSYNITITRINLLLSGR